MYFFRADLELQNLANSPHCANDVFLTPQPIRRSKRNAPRTMSALSDCNNQSVRPEIVAEIVKERDARRALALMKEEMENSDTMSKLSPQARKSQEIRHTESPTTSTRVSSSDKEVQVLLLEAPQNRSSKRKLYTPSEETPKSINSPIITDDLRKAYLKDSNDKKTKRAGGRKGIIKSSDDEAVDKKKVRFETDSEISEAGSESPKEESSIKKNLEKVSNNYDCYITFSQRICMYL